ncbi:hypothetical protein PMAYCL1PPCAC_13600, partial [Pristionchus mayeri]
PIDCSWRFSGQPDETMGGCMKMATDTTKGSWVSGDCVSAALPYFCSKKAVILNDEPQPAGCPSNAQ